MQLKFLGIVVFLLSVPVTKPSGETTCHIWHYAANIQRPVVGSIQLFTLRAQQTSPDQSVVITCPDFAPQQNLFSFAQDVYQELETANQKQRLSLYRKSSLHILHHLLLQSCIQDLQTAVESKEGAPEEVNVALQQLQRELTAQQKKLPLYAAVSAVTAELLLQAGPDKTSDNNLTGNKTAGTTLLDLLKK